MPRYLRETLRLLDFRSEEAVGQLAGRAPRFITTGVPRSDGLGPLRWWWFGLAVAGRYVSTPSA